MGAIRNDASVSLSESNTTISTKILSLDHVTCYWNSNKTMTEYTLEEDAVKESPQADDDNWHILKQEKSSALTDLALSNISIDFDINSLTFIVGSVGSGKSALLQALIGELPVSKGRVERRYKSLAYSPQDPWIMNGTIRENIIMGLPMDESYYQEVIASCGLSYDFNLFPSSDNTLVGDRGVQLSGGQRARISLARALYRNSDVVILDDPLSAVDAKVGRLIFYSAIQDLCLKRGKCVVLVTHQHQFIGDSRCILMSGGRIAQVGSFVDCIHASNGKLHMVVQNTNEVEEDSSTPSEDTPLPSFIKADYVSSASKESEKDLTSSADTQMMETKASGEISRGTFVSYSRAMGGYVVVSSLLILFTVTQASTISSILVMGRWAQRSILRQKDVNIIGLVAGLACTVLLLSVIRSLSSFARTIHASQKLHDEMTKAVLRTTIEFFDTNPSGRILNRFSADVGSNDDNLPGTLYDFMSTFFLTLGAISTCIVVLPFTLVVFPPLFWYFLRSRNIFVKTSRELKRLEGTARSPKYAMLNESLNGIATIRANDVVVYFRNKFEKLQNDHSRAFFAFIAGSRWIGFRMDSIMFIVITTACYLAVLFNQQGTVFISLLKI